MQIYIKSDSGGASKLWCYVNAAEDGWTDFYVINGGWTGKLRDDGLLIVDGTGSRFEGCGIAWRGVAPFADDRYNEAIEWIEQQISDEGGTP